MKLIERIYGGNALIMLSPAQVKGKIKNIAKENGADPRILMRIYMMERFFERVANSAFDVWSDTNYNCNLGGVL